MANRVDEVFAKVNVNVDDLFDKVRPQVQASSGAPILSERKRGFVKRRLIQTYLGCPRLIATHTPWYAILWQVAIFLLPVVGLVPGIALIETESVTAIEGAVVSGVILLATGIAVRMIVRKTRLDMRNMPALPQFIADEDDVDFSGCMGAELVDFLFPKKKLHIFEHLVHILLYGFIGAMGILYLLPSTMVSLYSTDAEGYVVLAFGWITVVSTMYSLLTAPAVQPAVFRAHQRFVDVDNLYRPVYCLLFFAIRFVTYEAVYGHDTGAVDRVLYAVFASLPLLWFLGILPPIDALFPWAAEQVCFSVALPSGVMSYLTNEICITQYLVIMLGGSPMATDTRLIFMCILSTGAFFITFLLLDYDSAPESIVAWGAIAGFVLACNLIEDFRKTLSSCSRGTKVAPLKEAGFEGRQLKTMSSHSYVEGFKAVLVSNAAVLFSTLIAAILCVDISEAESATNTFDGIIWAVWILSWILRNAQQVYVAGIRNPLYPVSTHSSINSLGQKRLRVIGKAFKVVRFIAPAVNAAVLSYTGNFVFSSWTSNVIMAFAITRGYRIVIQAPINTLFELSLLAFIRRVVQDDSVWLSLSSFVQLAIIGFANDRAEDLMDKVIFVLRFFYAFWTNKKLKTGFSVRLITCSVILSPIILAVVCFTSLLSAPLMPLFGLPIFIVAFPRPKRFWPFPGNNDCPKPETLYYKQIFRNLSERYARLIGCGSLGIVCAGSHYLVRFEDRTVHIQVLEVGFDYVLCAFKGLELGETTSCHDLEATRIGEMFDTAFENDRTGCRRFKHQDSVLLPLQRDFVRGYSDNTYSQTGVIDSPDTLAAVNLYLGYALVWILSHRLASKYPEKWRNYSSSTGSHVRNAKLRSIVPDSWISTVVQSITGQKDDAWGSHDSATVTEPAHCEPEDDEFADILGDKPTTIQSKTGVLNGSPKSQSAQLAQTTRLLASKCWESLTSTPSTVASVCAIFNNGVPSTLMSEPYFDPEMEKLVTKAYRYAVKLALDNFDPTAPGGQNVDDDELVSDLEEFDAKWFLGPEGNTSWNQAVENGVENLFSVMVIGASHPPEVQTRLLRTRDIEVRVGSLSSASIIGQWASLSHELLYFTNDDDERYSIQAHETALRNLTIQSADPPLGYPVFNKRVSVPLRLF